MLVRICGGASWVTGGATRKRRAMEKQWKEREKQIERVIKNTVGLYGDMQGIIGGQIPVIPALELDDSKQLATTAPIVEE